MRRITGLARLPTSTSPLIIWAVILVRLPPPLFQPKVLLDGNQLTLLIILIAAGVENLNKWFQSGDQAYLLVCSACVMTMIPGERRS